MKQDTTETWLMRGTTNFSNGTITLKNSQVLHNYIEQRNEMEVNIPFTKFRVWDDHTSTLPGTAAADDLGYLEGTWGPDAPTLQTIDEKANGGAHSMYAYFALEIDDAYVLGETIQIRFQAGMVTTVATPTATIDLEAYVGDADGSVGSDICTTAATTINTLATNEVDFTLTGGSISRGDTIHCRVAITINDAATATAVIGELRKASIVRDIRG